MAVVHEDAIPRVRLMEPENHANLRWVTLQELAELPEDRQFDRVVERATAAVARAQQLQLRNPFDIQLVQSSCTTTHYGLRCRLRRFIEHLGAWLPCCAFKRSAKGQAWW